ncbi:unnamed protein product [Amoebophrya sp. A25]|nr:unnamed protein product [Amoebophrya sp. A25]|eukprot:GSA25T00013950001.1
MLDIPLTSLVVTVASAFFLCALAVGGGVGGGALYMPVYVGLLEDAHLAVPLAKITTNGVAWSAFFFNLFAAHPDDKRRPLINYDVALIMEPLTLIGTIIGVALNVVLTSGHVLVTLVTVLGFTAYRTIAKGLAQREKELAFLKEREESGNTPLQAGRSIQLERFPSTTVQGLSGSEDRDPLLTDPASSSSTGRWFPWDKFSMMLALWVFHICCLTYADGPFAIVCGSPDQQGALVLNLAVQTIFTLVWRRRCLKQQSEKQFQQSAAAQSLASQPLTLFADESSKGSGGHLVHESFQFGEANTLVYPFLSGVAGVCAGSLGIAGGLIKGPLMVDWGLAAQSATATAIFMIMFTSSSTILQFIILGRLDLHMSILLWLTGFSGGLLGSKIVAHILKRLNRQSFVTLFLGFIIVASAVCMCSVVVLQITGVFAQPKLDDNLDYCALAAAHR